MAAGRATSPASPPDASAIDGVPMLPLDEASPPQNDAPPKKKLTKAERLAAEEKRKRECVLRPQSTAYPPRTPPPR